MQGQIIVQEEPCPVGELVRPETLINPVSEVNGAERRVCHTPESLFYDLFIHKFIQKSTDLYKTLVIYNPDCSWRDNTR